MDAYSEDLRKKIVQALSEQRMNNSEAARAFGVSLSSVKRYPKAVSEGRSLKSRGRLRARNPSLRRRQGGSLRLTSTGAPVRQALR
jgi:transposase